MKNPKNLKWINLNYNELKDEGFYSIIEGACKGNSRLEYLDISQNRIKLEKTSLELIEILKRKNMREIVLSHNKLTAQSCEVLRDTYKSMKYDCFTKLQLDHNKIGDESGEYLGEIIKNSKTLFYLGIMDC